MHCLLVNKECIVYYVTNVIIVLFVKKPVLTISGLKKNNFFHMNPSLSDM